MNLSSPTADEATVEVMRLSGRLIELLDKVIAPADRTADRLPEQLSFLQLRENFRCFVDLIADGRDIPAAHLARALFEESPDGPGSM